MLCSASASEDCTVKVWQIPDGGITRTMTECVVDLVFHQRRVGIVLWHPSAQNILLSAGSDNNVCIWNVGTGMKSLQREVALDAIASLDQLMSVCQ